MDQNPGDKATKWIQQQKKNATCIASLNMWADDNCGALPMHASYKITCTIVSFIEWSADHR